MERDPFRRAAAAVLTAAKRWDAVVYAVSASRYLVSDTPRGVEKNGWHRLEVRVKGRRTHVKARPGYLLATARG